MPACECKTADTLCRCYFFLSIASMSAGPADLTALWQQCDAISSSSSHPFFLGIASLSAGAADLSAHWQRCDACPSSSWLSFILWQSIAVCRSCRPHCSLAAPGHTLFLLTTTLLCVSIFSGICEPLAGVSPRSIHSRLGSRPSDLFAGVAALVP